MAVDAIRPGELPPTPATPTRAGSASGPHAIAPDVSRRARWTGRVLSGLGAAFLLLDAAGKLARPAPVVEGTVRLGYPETVIVPLGVVLLLSTLLYLVPRTSPLGVILLTAYLGGAVATHVRVGDPLASHVLFPVYLAVVLWAGLWLRDARLRAFVTPRRRRDVPAR